MNCQMSDYTSTISRFFFLVKNSTNEVPVNTSTDIVKKVLFLIKFNLGAKSPFFLEFFRV